MCAFVYAGSCLFWLCCRWHSSQQWPQQLPLYGRYRTLQEFINATHISLWGSPRHSEDSLANDMPPNPARPSMWPVWLPVPFQRLDPSTDPSLHPQRVYTSYRNGSFMDWFSGTVFSCWSLSGPPRFGYKRAPHRASDRYMTLLLTLNPEPRPGHWITEDHQRRLPIPPRRDEHGVTIPSPRTCRRRLSRCSRPVLPYWHNLRDTRPPGGTRSLATICLKSPECMEDGSPWLQAAEEISRWWCGCGLSTVEVGPDDTNCNVTSPILAAAC